MHHMQSPRLYHRVMTRLVMPFLSWALARPMSAIFSFPSLVSSRLLSLRSRCKMGALGYCRRVKTWGVCDAIRPFASEPAMRKQTKQYNSPAQCVVTLQRGRVTAHSLLNDTRLMEVRDAVPELPHDGLDVRGG